MYLVKLKEYLSFIKGNCKACNKAQACPEWSLSVGRSSLLPVGADANIIRKLSVSGRPRVAVHGFYTRTQTTCDVFVCVSYLQALLGNSLF